MTRTPRKPRVLSLFSGIGGIDLAWEMAGGVIAGQVEIDPFCQQVLAKHWPDVKRVDDVRRVWGDTFDGGPNNPIDLVAGGFPCQPFSVAGARRGRDDDRFLWPEMLRVIQVYQPAWVLGENVAGFIGLALDDTLADLERAGYEARAFVLPAAAVGAPHKRERVFIVGHRMDNPHGADWQAGHIPASQRVARQDCLATPTDDVAHAHDNRQPRPQLLGGNAASGASAERRHAGQHINADGATGDVEHASGAGRQERHPARVAGDTGHPARRSAPDGRDRQAEPAVGGGADGLSRRLDGSASDANLSYPYQPWPAGPGQAQHEWEPPRTTTERIPNRAARLKALGNAVVPQQVYPILAAIIEQIRQQQGQVKKDGGAA